MSVTVAVRIVLSALAVIAALSAAVAVSITWQWGALAVLVGGLVLSGLAAMHGKRVRQRQRDALAASRTR